MNQRNEQTGEPGAEAPRTEQRILSMSPDGKSASSIAHTLRKRIEAVGDPALTDVERRWRCVMDIHLNDGRVLHGQTMAAKGSYENPLTRAEEEEKALDLITPVLGKTRSKNLLASLWNLDAIKDVRTLRKLYTA